MIRRKFLSSLMALPLVRLLPIAKPKPTLAFHPKAFQMVWPEPTATEIDGRWTRYYDELTGIAYSVDEQFRRDVQFMRGSQWSAEEIAQRKSL